MNSRNDLASIAPLLLLFVASSVSAEACHVETLKHLESLARSLEPASARSSALTSVAKALVSHGSHQEAVALLADIAIPYERDLVRSDAVEAFTVSGDEGRAFELATSHEIPAFRIRSYAKLARYTENAGHVESYFRLAEAALVAEPPGFWRERGCSNLADAYASLGDFVHAFQRADKSCSGEFSARALFGIAEIAEDVSVSDEALARGESALEFLNDAHMQSKSQAERIGPMLRHGSVKEALNAADITSRYLDQQSDVDAAIGYADMASAMWKWRPVEAKIYFMRAVSLSSSISDAATRIDVLSVVLHYLGRAKVNDNELCFDLARSDT